jgi:hypothetical protein
MELKKKLDMKIVISITFVLLILSSSLFLEENFVVAAVSTSKTITSTGLMISAGTPTPPVTGNRSNGIWTQAGSSITTSELTALKGHAITKIYVLAAEWKWNEIVPVASVAQLQSAVALCHGLGMKVYPWIGAISTWNGVSGVNDGHCLDISTNTIRASNIAKLVTFVQAYGFDGMAEDVESPDGSLNNFVDYSNAARAAMNAIGKEYFATVVDAWLQDPMSNPNQFTPQQIARLQVDRLQVMLYGGYGGINPIYDMAAKKTAFQDAMDNLLTYATCPVGLVLHSDTGGNYYQDLHDSQHWVDEQFTLGTSKTHLAGFDIFWHDNFPSTNTQQWSEWDNWSTKN